MFIAKKHLSRRTVLRGMGASLALPLLDSMAPAQTPWRNTVASPRIRLACIEMVHGAAGSTDEGARNHLWSPEKDGSGFDFSYSLEPLTPFREYITIVSGADARQAEAFAPTEVGADHFRSSAVFLTATHPKQTGGPDFLGGISIDQLYAEQSQDTPLPSIQLGIEHLEPTNSCGFIYNCIYSDAISWASPTTPLSPTINPRLAFENLFGSRGPAADRAFRQAAGHSLLDAIAPDAVRLQNTLGPGDRSRLSQYLEEVRGVEGRIQAIEKHNASGGKESCSPLRWAFRTPGKNTSS
jgi:hypothetical protein